MEQKEYFEFIGEYIYKSSKCEEYTTLLIATKEYTVPVINDVRFNFATKIEILKSMLSTKYKKFVDEKYDLIGELNKIKSIRNDFAHGVITIDANSIHILITEEIMEGGEWGQNVKKSYRLDKIPEMKEAIDVLQHNLLLLWHKIHEDKRRKKALTYKATPIPIPKK